MFTANLGREANSCHWFQRITLTVQHTNDKINSPVFLEHFAVNWLEGKFTNEITDDKEGTAIFSRCCRESNL